MTQSPRWGPAAVPSSEARGPSGGSILGEACRGVAAYPSQAAHACPAWLGPQHQKPHRRTGAQASADTGGWVVASGPGGHQALGTAWVPVTAAGQHPALLSGLPLWLSCAIPGPNPPQPA